MTRTTSRGGAGARGSGAGASAIARVSRVYGLTPSSNMLPRGAFLSPSALETRSASRVASAVRCPSTRPTDSSHFHVTPAVAYLLLPWHARHQVYEKGVKGYVYTIVGGPGCKMQLPKDERKGREC